MTSRKWRPTQSNAGQKNPVNRLGKSESPMSIERDQPDKDFLSGSVMEVEYSIKGTIDQLYLCLMKAKGNHYQRQAWDLMRKIPLYNPRPSFEIRISDLSQEVQKELTDRWNYKDAIDYILKEAVDRIFRNINEDYYLLSVKRLLKVRMV
jgi:hypothetical protein